MSIEATNPPNTPSTIVKILRRRKRRDGVRPTDAMSATIHRYRPSPAQIPLVVPTTERLRRRFPAALAAQRRQIDANSTRKNVLRHRSAGGIAPQAIRTGQSLTRSTEVCGRPLPRCRCFSAFFVRPSPFSLKLLLQIAKV